MLGSAFIRARYELNQAKKSDTEIYLISNDDKFDHRINTILKLLYFLRKKMTKNQRKIYDAFLYYQKYGKIKLQTELAKKINVSDAMISKTLKTIGYEEMVNGEQLVLELLTDLYNKLTV